MIKVYVVDDEKLVRRGIIGLIDWGKYGMEVAGDSGNGEEAMEFMKNEKIDLLFSDLSMPGLSGITFLKEVKAVHPDIRIVVLTMHQDFGLIQQALRVGILDYITKAQIEEENIASLMEDIKTRYWESMHHSQLREKMITGNEVYIWETEGKNDREEAAALLEQNGFSYETLSDTHLMLSGEYSVIRLETLIKEYGAPKSSLIGIKKVKGIPYDQLEDTLRTVIKRKLFADRRQGCFTYTYSYPELPEHKTESDRKDIVRLSMKMEFMFSDELYQRGMERMKYADFSPEERVAAFYHFNLFWSEFSEKDFTHYFQEVEQFRWWYQWREWFDDIRRLVLLKAGGINEEIGIMEAIHRAMNYIREHMDKEIPLEALLKLTGMSKSHFSRNFKKITGKTFVTYLNDMRIDSAKKYLMETKQSVYWIARRVGYADEHYFRKIFKEHTGESPKKYRDNADKYG